MLDCLTTTLTEQEPRSNRLWVPLAAWPSLTELGEAEEPGDCRWKEEKEEEEKEEKEEEKEEEEEEEEEREEDQLGNSFGI